MFSGVKSGVKIFSFYLKVQNVIQMKTFQKVSSNFIKEMLKSQMYI